MATGKNYSGYLITLEGPDGSGKTSAIGGIVESLRSKGLSVVNFREPGGTAIGDQVRIILHAMSNENMDAKAEVLLFQSSRAQNVEENVYPHLLNGDIVILDRFGDSSIAYQGFARRMGADWINTLNNFSTRHLEPDLTVLLDIDPEIALQRRLKGLDMGEEWTRLDAAGLKFHRDVRKAYNILYTLDETNRWERVDAELSREEVQRNILSIIECRLSAAGFIEGNPSGKERRG